MEKITCLLKRFNPKSVLHLFVFQLFFLTTMLQAQTQYNGCNLGGSSSDPTGYYGGFENGANNFGANASTDLVIIAAGNLSSGQGKVATNGNAVSGGASIAPHSGSNLLLAHPKSNDDRLWYKTMAVTPGVTYEFCFYAANIKANPSSLPLNIVMNGVTVTSQTIITSQTNAAYTQVCGQYTVPAGVTSMEIAITDPLAGNDGAQGKSHFLALDDLCFKQITVFTLGNQVWFDYNNNGIKDAGEPALGGVVVKLYDGSGVYTGTSMITDANGNYLFTNLPAGNYSVGIVIPSGYTNAFSSGTSILIDNQNDGNAISGGEIKTATFSLTSSTTTVDFALIGVGSIGDFVWDDTNADGVQDSGESGISGVTVTLTGTDSLGNSITMTTTTNANGQYLFSNLPQGTYTVTFGTPKCYLSSPASTPISNATNSDAVAGVVANINLSAGQNITYVDAGFHLPIKPTLACYQTATFNTTSCQWDVTGTQPVRPTTACYETATFNTTSCQWDVTGTQPVRPTTACYETATFNTTSCQWDVTGEQAVAPTVSFVDNCNGTWTVTAYNYTGSLLWSTNATTPSITVTATGLYSVKQVINGCAGATASVSVVKTCLTADVFHTGTTCGDFRQGGNGYELDNLCYSANNGKIGVVTPGVFFYYTAIVAPSSNFTIKVTETKGASSSVNQFGLMAIHASNQIVLWDPNCNKFSDAGIIMGSNNSQGSLTITNAVPGATYVLSVKYNPKSIQGNAYSGNVAPTVTYNFSTSVDNLNDGIANNFTIVPNSQTSIDLVSGCSVTNPVAATTTTTARTTSSFDVYPVPFNNELNVKYHLQNDSEVTVEIFDVRGVLLQTATDSNGYNEKEIKLNVDFSAKSGQVYILRVTTNSGSETKKIIAIKE